MLFAGTSSLAVAFGSSVVAAFVTPALIRKIGCRLVIIVAECGYLIYVICNVYSCKLHITIMKKKIE